MVSCYHVLQYKYSDRSWTFTVQLIFATFWSQSGYLLQATAVTWLLYRVWSQKWNLPTIPWQSKTLNLLCSNATFWQQPFHHCTQCSLVTTRVAKHRGVGSLCHARSASEEHLIVGNTWNQKIYPPLYATSIDDCILRIIIYLRFGAIGPASPFKKEEYYVASCGPVLPTL